MAEEWVALRYPETAGTALFPAASVEAWLGRGWERIPEITDETPPEPVRARRQKDKE